MGELGLRGERGGCQADVEGMRFCKCRREEIVLQAQHVG